MLCPRLCMDYKPSVAGPREDRGTRPCRRSNLLRHRQEKGLLKRWEGLRKLRRAWSSIPAGLPEYSNG